MPQNHNLWSFWANYNNSLTWIKAIWGWFPLLTMISSEQKITISDHRFSLRDADSTLLRGPDAESSDLWIPVPKHGPSWTHSWGAAWAGQALLNGLEGPKRKETWSEDPSEQLPSWTCCKKMGPCTATLLQIGHDRFTPVQAQLQKTLSYVQRQSQCQEHRVFPAAVLALAVGSGFTIQLEI